MLAVHGLRADLVENEHEVHLHDGQLALTHELLLDAGVDEVDERLVDLCALLGDVGVPGLGKHGHAALVEALDECLI